MLNVMPRLLELHTFRPGTEREPRMTILVLMERWAAVLVLAWPPCFGCGPIATLTGPRSRMKLYYPSVFRREDWLKRMRGER